MKNCWLTYFVLLAAFMGCVKDGHFDPPTNSCVTDFGELVSFAQVKGLYKGQLVQIQEDWVILGYVSSSDRAGNFFSVLYFQDSPENPSEGFQIQIDLRDSYLWYPVGSKIYIKLKGLYLGKRKGVFALGGTFSGFGTSSVGRLPALKIPDHLLLSCDDPANMIPQTISITELDTLQTNTLVRIDNVEFKDTMQTGLFTIDKELTTRILTDCLANELAMLNSGFADFATEPLPQANGSVIGVLLRENNTFFMAIRSLEDLNLDQERCQDLVTQFTSDQVFFSELADPNNNAGARFIELYNAATADLSLNGWAVHRYTNANTTISSTIDLSAYTIGAQSTLVIAPNDAVFNQVYGFAPTIGVGTNSPADANGDDNLVLVDPFGKQIDIFGVIGEDGSGTNHEFEDGRALRKPQVDKGNPIYDATEWILYNDTGGPSTTNLPQNAPEDFTPGTRN